MLQQWPGIMAQSRARVEFFVTHSLKTIIDPRYMVHWSYIGQFYGRRLWLDGPLCGQQHKMMGKTLYATNIPHGVW